MDEAVNEKLRRKYRILVAPLDWGLGHATRCIPIITELLRNNCEVWLAGEGAQEALLRSEFPSLPFLKLPGYRIRYSRNGRRFFFKIISQVPRIISVIRMEHRWLKKMTRIHGFDGVISDNRFGLYHAKIPAIFITHQLAIKSPLGKWSEVVLRTWNYKCINRFRECWIPDFAGDNNLSGALSHPGTKPRVPLRYVGLLSRFEKDELEEIKGHLLFILSGPEPQRTILENRIVNHVSHYSGTATIIRGLPGASSIIPSTGMLKFHNHLPAKELNEEMEKADYVISRSGYSTVMDLVKLGKKSILIPTPGQTEQEYLGRYLMQKQIAFTIEQMDSSLGMVLEKAKEFRYKFPPARNSDELEKTVIDFLKRL